jgi:D-alanyl-D-alanine dipeptidase
MLVRYIRTLKRQRNIRMKYKIIRCLYFQILATLALLSGSYPCTAQDTVISKYGLGVISSIKSYEETVNKDSQNKMIDIQALIPDMVLDLRYAGTNNFMKRRMYPEGTGRSYLRLPAARALMEVQKDLNSLGLGLKIFDAYRPYSVTEKFWELVHDDRYVADPSKGSNHNRGVAIDLTLIDLRTGKELLMPTGFDNFTDSAHHDFMNLPEEAIKNRKLLRESMEKQGFIAFPTEWWHYGLPNPERFAVLDLSFTDLKH